MRVWLDDIRNPRYYRLFSHDDEEADRWMGKDVVWVKTESACIELLKTGLVTHISLDHDLGPKSAGTGHGVTLWIEKAAHDGLIPQLSWTIHSSNTAGSKNMRDTLRSAERFWGQKPQTTPVYHKMETD